VQASRNRGVFQRLLLLQKKKYAAVKVEDGFRSSTEMKGLNMKPGEYCSLSKAVLQYVLDQILSGEATGIVVERIPLPSATMCAAERSSLTSSSSTSGWAKTPRTTPTPKASRTYRTRHDVSVPLPRIIVGHDMTSPSHLAHRPGR
jgi:hypothetical protein